MSNDIFNTFSEHDINSLAEVIEKLEKSQFDYLELENDGMKIVIGKNKSANNVMDLSEVSDKQAVATVAKEEQKETEHPAETVQKTSSASSSAAEENSFDVKAKEDEALITANTAGLFYAQPEPGAPPYVQVGDMVEEDSTVGLVEIMKVYSAITAGVSGEITKIHVENQELIEYGQPLFTVKTH
ncbi:acetyl-CoA carboxylase biotin carboxyl carrier protein [Alteribacillus persepolensis]|uniref:Biotin carboxyl carrier protein of acetyl-CoA carboxylase n=1 Tax=Alteribacillus persepolensis TaxID=568899 RepID=A0A1G8FVV5_9BACI|nr:biotin/lipoyl-containing protein [Alteribacillus persepolensis]SDH86190.1 acetyl-CoA carboxylase biotin carboxyl carrier protein [Alteribacillus persepolensis]